MALPPKSQAEEQAEKSGATIGDPGIRAQVVHSQKFGSPLPEPTIGKASAKAIASHNRKFKPED